MHGGLIQIAQHGGLTGEFLHAVDLKNWMLVHNLGIANYLFSPDWIGPREPGLAKTYRPIDQIPMADLEAGKLPGNVVAPRAAQHLILGAMLEQNIPIRNGYGEPLDYPENSRNRIIEMGKVEVEFERGRREFCPQAPSRLSCFWLAEDSPSGRAVINSMLRNHYITRVKVPRCSSAFAADAEWFDDYLNSRRPSAIRSYWEGASRSKSPQWEILVNGIIEFIEPDELDHIAKNGQRPVARANSQT